jgi:hypothetical protein
MKMLVSGVQGIAGTAKASGNAFDMCNVLALVPIENFNNGKTKVEGFGYKVMELALERSVLPQFAGMVFPLMLDLHTEPRPRNGKLETVVIGFKAEKA